MFSFSLPQVYLVTSHLQLPLQYILPPLENNKDKEKEKELKSCELREKEKFSNCSKEEIVMIEEPHLTLYWIQMDAIEHLIELFMIR